MPVSIKGKDYTTCAERMELLRQSNKTFEIASSEPIQLGDRVVWHMVAIIDGHQFIGNAECHLNARPGSADATDPFACGETSALARLLGFAGYGSVDSIASADEIVRGDSAAKDKNAPASSGNIELDDMPPSSGQWDNIRELARHLGTGIKKPKTFKEAAQMLDQMQSEWEQMKSRGRAS